MPNVAAIIRAHNKKVLSADCNEPATNMCNCRRKEDCPLNGKCKTSGVIYSATVTRDNNPIPSRYIGLTENQFKRRYYQHQHSFRNESYRHSTELSNHIWDLKASNTPYNIEWSVIKSAAPYSSASKRCNLCLTEKLMIAAPSNYHPLNKRSELISKCRHENKFYLSNYKGVT
jgi:hypothetical protein